MSIAQPPLLTCARCTTPYYQTKKIILFACSPWHSHPEKGGHPFSLLSLMACTWWFQLTIFSFGWYVIPARHFPQKSLSGNPRISSLFSPPSDHTLTYLWPMTHHSCIGWVQIGGAWPCTCSTSVYVQSLSAAHAFAMVWRLICVFCCSSLTSCGVNCFLIFHSL